MSSRAWWSGRRTTVPAILGVLALLVAGLSTVSSVPAAAATPWLCHPAYDADECRGDLTTTVQRPDGTSRVAHPSVTRRPRIDCFYVYPTSSQQPTPNAMPRPEASVRAVARQQVRRFSSSCRVFAPLYRQRTLVALTAEAGTTDAQKASYNRIAYRDVLAAWRDYLQRSNRGRGFVLIGHSQGSRLLRKLIREQIDPRPAVRSRLVSAILPGANVLVRRGSDRGGDFAHVPVCRRASQVGCVLAWSTVGATPPDDTRFGVPTYTGPDAGLALPHGPAYSVVCTNPASLARNRRVTAHTVARSEMFPGLLGVLLLGLYGGLPPTAATPFLVPAERYTVHCETANGARVLRLRPLGDARQLHPEPNDTWGLHLIDVNIVLGDLVRLVGAQSRAYLGVSGRTAGGSTGHGG